MIQRDAKFYAAGFEGENPREAPFYLRALVFDGKDGDFNSSLINEFNVFLENRNEGNKECLSIPLNGSDCMPRKIIIVNASHDDLPTSYETARIFENFCEEKGYGISAKVVNSRDDLMGEIKGVEKEVLLISQCVDKHVYNVELSSELEDRGVVIVPGKITAPGSVFSDKDSTYKLLSENGKKWDMVARYRKVTVKDKSIRDVVDGIFSSIEEIEEETGQAIFFVKPHEGGGGLGGFRVTKNNDGYVLPDLSKVTGDSSEVHPTFIDLDVENEHKLRELLWVHRLFATDEELSSNYLKVQLPLDGKEEKEAIAILKEYLLESRKKRRKKLNCMTITKEEAKNRLKSAINIFEKKFNRRYLPLVNEHINFGLWGLRAHYRLSRGGPFLETMYHRVFQLAFTEEGLGYLGADNISNKQTGDLEILRLGPVNRIMMDAVGGKDALFETLLKGAEALMSLNDLIKGEDRCRVPLRVQIDLAAVSRRIGEGNADTARGLCLASRWTEFVYNAREWLKDSLSYYAWKKSLKY